MLTDLNSKFPQLVTTGYLRTSCPTIDYNCIAWAMSDNKHWWEPDQDGLFVWPDTLQRSYALFAFVNLFKHHGYQKCSNDVLEAGYDKIAIYTISRQFKHVARQLADGKWTSKLGCCDDITHTLDGLKGGTYGLPTIFMKKAISP